MKQIVGSTLKDSNESNSSSLITNFVSDRSPAEYAQMYLNDGLLGGHVIMLGADPLSQSAALEALHAYPGYLSVLMEELPLNLILEFKILILSQL